MNNTALDQRGGQAQASETTIFELLHAAHALEDKVEAALGKAGLSMAKFAVLNELVSSGEALPLSELATRLSCVKSNMTQLVDRLQADGLVQRVQDPADRRSVKAEITASGGERQAAAAMEMAQLQAQFSSAVGPQDRSTLERLLGALK